MQLNDSLTSMQSFFEMIGYLRLSTLFSSQNQSTGQIIQKTARVVMLGFSMLSVYDYASNDLPFKAKILVNGTLFFVITCLGLSLLLKIILKPSIQSEELPQLEKKAELFEKTSEIKTPFVNNTICQEDRFSPEFSILKVKRNLLDEFENEHEQAEFKE